MTDTKYTPEPWSYHQRGTYFVLTGGARVTIDGSAKNEANARRIVACVNACVGITTEELEELPPYELEVRMGWDR